MTSAIRKLFSRDDYASITRYFAPLRADVVYADPSGWLDTICSVADTIIQPKLTTSELAHYCLDHGEALATQKNIIANAISHWERRDVATSEFTLFHSVSAATLAVLLFLKERGIKTLIMETPAYIITIEQATAIGIKVVLLPSYEEDGFAVDWMTALRRRRNPAALWLTQPRMSLGFNQYPEEIMLLTQELGNEEFLIIDEATEQMFPSQLRDVSLQSSRIIRLRGMLKAIGLNGLRLAFVLHHKEWRRSFESVQELVGNSLDAFSLRVAADIAQISGRLEQLLMAANNQVVTLRKKAEILAHGSGIGISRLINGYIGCASVDLRGLKGGYADKRRKLLKFCKTRKMPVLLGRNMRFAVDHTREHVRLNYFSREQHITRAVKVLSDFMTES